MKINSTSKKTQQRCENLYQVGLEMFLQHGYEKTSLSKIVEKTGGSLATIYKYFGNKEDFFEAIIFKEVEEFYAQLEKKLKQEQDQSFENFLYKFGIEYLQTFLTTKAILIGKILYKEAHLAKNDMTRQFMGRVQNIIYKIFLEHINTNNLHAKLATDDYDKMAFEFCLLLREPEFTKSVVSNKVEFLTQNQIEKKVKNVVKFFQNGYVKS